MERKIAQFLAVFYMITKHAYRIIFHEGCNRNFSKQTKHGIALNFHLLTWAF